MRPLLGGGGVDVGIAAVIERYGPAVRQYLRVLLRDPHDAADAFSVFEEHVWRGLAGFRAESSLRNWIFRVAHNAATDVRKEAWRRQGRPLPPAAANELVDERADRLSHVSELREEFDRLRPYLSGPERALLSLRIEQELTWREIARVLSCDHRKLDTTTVIKRFHRLSARLSRMARLHGLV